VPPADHHEDDDDLRAGAERARERVVLLCGRGASAEPPAPGRGAAHRRDAEREPDAGVCGDDLEQHLELVEPARELRAGG
jgi:hypothetical protein